MRQHASARLLRRAPAAGLTPSACASQSWLEWTGYRKLLFGLHANRKWHYTRDQQPNRHVRWFIRSVGAPQTETILNLYASFKAWLTCSLPPWTVEAREAEAEEAAAFESDDAAAAEGSIGGHVAVSTTSSVRSARALARYKRIMTATGFVGTYICWAVFSWSVQMQSASSLRHPRHTR